MSKRLPGIVLLALCAAVLVGALAPASGVSIVNAQGCVDYVYHGELLELGTLQVGTTISVVTEGAGNGFHLAHSYTTYIGYFSIDTVSSYTVSFVTTYQAESPELGSWFVVCPPGVPTPTVLPTVVVVTSTPIPPTATPIPDVNLPLLQLQREAFIWQVSSGILGLGLLVLIFLRVRL